MYPSLGTPALKRIEKSYREGSCVT